MDAAEVGFMVFIALLALVAIGLSIWALYKINTTPTTKINNDSILYWNSGSGGNYTTYSFMGWGAMYSQSVQTSILINEPGTIKNFTVGIDPGTNNTTNSFTFRLLINGKAVTTQVLNGTSTVNSTFTTAVNAGDLVSVQVANPSNLSNFGVDTLMASVTFSPQS